MDCRLLEITVHFEAFGEGRPLIVLPGWPDDWRVPADYLEPLFRDREGWRRVYLDLPGRRAAMVDGLLQVVPWVLSPGFDDGLPQRVTLVANEALIARIEVELGPELAAVFVERLVVQSPDVYDRFKELLPGIQRSDAAFLAQLGLREPLSFDVDRLSAPFPGPALFLLGRQDAVVGYRSALALMEDYPRATVAVLDRSGHALPWEQEDLFMALTGEWLARVEEATAIPAPRLRIQTSAGSALSRSSPRCRTRAGTIDLP